MKISINYPQLAAEFVIVFVGVAVALAADEWRQNLAESSKESAYLARITRDLKLGEQQIEDMLARFSRVSEASTKLSEILETKGPYDNNDQVLILMAQTAMLGPITVLHHDITYRELISTGGLQNISDFRLRESLDAYFLSISQTQNLRAEMDTRFGDRIIALTGRPPFNLEGEFDQISDNVKLRLMNDIESSPESVESARNINSQSFFIISRLNRLLEQNIQLQQSIG